jgi:DNA ligase (NAD+)
MELKRLGFSPCAFFMQKRDSTEQELQDTVDELRIMADVDGLPIDGIVITYNDISYSKACGRTGHHYKDGIALKFSDDLHETILRSIEWQPSRSGELSPVAVFDTIEIDGCDVSRASLHNVSFIKEKELKPGCRVLVSKRNQIIPHIEENLDRDGFDMSVIPGRCPCCNGSTRIQTSHKDKKVTHTLRCDNPDCASQRLRQFVHFVSEKAMDIDGLSEATLQKFISRDWLNKLTDIFLLDEYADEIINMDGFGEKSWGRLWTAIEHSRLTTFEQFVVAMDISMIGRTASRELSRHFNSSLDDFMFAVDSGYDFTRLNAFGETLHRNIHNWFSKEENIKLWKELQTMITIKTKNNAIATADADNPFAGRTIVVTGKLEHFSRDSINAKIESLGARAGSAVSAKTDYLIAGEKAGSKLSKAQTLGITILSEAEFLNMVGAA